MPQLQWLGTLPGKKSYLAEALKGGMEGYFKGKEGKEKRQLELDKISFDKKEKAADLIIKSIGYATPQQKEELIGEGSQAGELVLDVYGEEALNTLRGVSGKGKAEKIAKVGTWIATKSKNIMGYPVKRDRAKMDIDIALELNDVDWKTTYPSLATKFKTSYAPSPKKEKEGIWPWSKKENVYEKMNEQELYSKAMTGDSKAKEEAKRRGYMK